jgi:signal transduction histidine kinase
MIRLRPRGIRGRLATLLVVAVVPVFLAGVVAMMVFVAQDARRLQLEPISRDLGTTAAALEFESNAIQSDVRFLASVPPVRGIIRAWANGGIDPFDGSTESEWLSRMRIIFWGFQQTRPVYEEIRFLDRRGTEIARETSRSDSESDSRAGGRASASDRELIAQMATLSDGQVYISPIGTEGQNGPPGMRDRLALSVATPAVDERGQVQGLVVVRVPFDDLLTGILRTHGMSMASLFVADQAGRYLHHSAPSLRPQTGRHDAASDESLKTDFAAHWRAILDGHDGAIATPSGTVLTESSHMWGAGDRFLVLAAVVPYWSVAEIISNAAVLKVLLFSTAFLTFLVVIAVWPIGLGFVRPILGLADVVARFRQGDQTVRAEVESDDELGRLGQAFNQMADAVTRSQAALEEQVRDRTVKLDQSRRAALSLLQDATAQRKAAEAAAAKLAASELAVRARAKWAQDLQEVSEELAACKTIDEVARVAAHAPVARLGARRAWVSAPDATGQRVVVASSSISPPSGEAIGECPSALCLAAGSHCEADLVGAPPLEGCCAFAQSGGFGSCGTWLSYSGDGAVLCAVTILFPESGGNSPVVAAGPSLDVFSRQVGNVWDHIVTEDNLRELAERLGRATEAADAANRAKSAFLASMSHELRTPLGAIIGFSELLDERLFGDLTPKQAEYVRDIADSGRHLLALINDILDLSKIEAGKTDLALSTFPIAAVLAGSLVMVKEKCIREGIVLTTDIEASLEGLHITADERRLKQVMFNLLSNAAKFSPRGSSITTSARRDGDDVLVSVIDTGSGVSKEHQDRLFDEFYQVAGGHSGKTPGTGLGLSIARGLVETQGGRIWMESAGEGLGCAFRFTIPIRPAQAADAPFAPGQPETVS